MKLFSKRESGQAFILVLILLVVGGLIIAPLLAFVSTGLKAVQLCEQKTDELYAADAGVEDALWKIINNDASLHGLVENEFSYYTLTQQVNSLPVNVTVTKLSLIEGLLSEEEYKLGQPHEGWGEFELPPPDQGTRNYYEGWVEYSCNVTFTYNGTGNRQLVTMGVFFAPFPGDRNLIEGPYYVVYTPVMTSCCLEDGSPETKIASGGFSFIWRWGKNPPRGPIFYPDDTGAVSFKFRIHDPDWSYSNCFVWNTFKEPDIAYVTNAPELHKWLIEAKAGDTTVRSLIIEDIGALSILTWEIDPPG